MKHRKVTKKIAKQAIEDMNFFYGIEITEIQFLYLMLNNKELQDDWSEVGDIDTAFREELVQAITRDCNIKSNEGYWPTGRTTKKNKIAFGVEFREKAIKMEYGLVDL